MKNTKCDYFQTPLLYTLHNSDDVINFIEH